MIDKNQSSSFYRMSSQPKKISIPIVLPQITKAWSPKLLANLNGEFDVKIAKLRGEYVFHAHPDTDELFYVVSGTLIMKLREDGNPESHVLEDIVVSLNPKIVIDKSSLLSCEKYS
jgi:mannose-6-phosphate isomerase-like protein (cupin superfamily)